MDDIAIKIEELSKIYRLYDKPIDRMKESLNIKRKKYHKEYYALQNITFEVKKGETIGIIGTNGSGKSTLLKIITGVLTPTHGSVAVNGRISALLELGAGFNPEYTGIGNIYLNGTMMGFSKKEIENKIEQILEFADIGEFIDQPVKTYSSGMFARLAFAVAINVEPEILIVDEALSVGDSAFQAKCISKMKKMMKLGVTILFVTHDMGTVKSFCEKCVYLNNGNIEAIGPAKEIADLYLSNIRVKMNTINFEVIKDVIHKKNDVLTIKEEKSNNDFIFDNTFNNKVKLFREGTGVAKVTAFKFLDLENNTLSIVQFNQQVRLLIYILFIEDVDVTIGYHIRDDKNTELIGNSIRLISGDILSGKKGDKYIVEFSTKIPLIEGNYNITLIVSTPADDEGNSALFVDYIENVHVFQVEKRPNIKIWDKVYLPVEYQIIKK